MLFFYWVAGGGGRLYFSLFYLPSHLGEVGGVNSYISALGRALGRAMSSVNANKNSELFLFAKWVKHGNVPMHHKTVACVKYHAPMLEIKANVTLQVCTFYVFFLLFLVFDAAV